MMKNMKPKKQTQKAKPAANKQKKAQKTSKRSMTTKTKKVVKKKVTAKTTAAAPMAVPKAMMSTSVPVMAATSSKIPASSLPSQLTNFGVAKLPGLAPMRNIKRQSSASFKHTLQKFNEEGAVELSPAKVIFQAQKQLQIDTSTLSKELNPGVLDRDLASKGLSYKVNDEGVITLMQKKHGYNIEFVFDREFEFADQQEEQEEEQNNEEEQDEGKFAFHNITITLTKGGWGSLRLGGQIYLNQDMKLQTFTPYQENGTELRTVSTEDLSDAAVNSIFDALEVICLSDQDCGVIIEVARQERLKTHLQSLDFLTNFFDAPETH